jgi:hypothetical protein
VTDTGTAPAGTPGASSDIPFDVDGQAPGGIVLDEARDHLRAAAKKLRRLAEDLDDAKTDTTLDTFVALDTLKKGGEAIVNATKKQIGDRETGVMEALMEQFAERGVSSERHAASGRLAHINQRVFPGIVEGHEKGEVAEVMKTVDELADFVDLGFNLNSLRSHFGERIKALKEQGTVIDDAVLARLIPDELKGLLELVQSPVISVRS